MQQLYCNQIQRVSINAGPRNEQLYEITRELLNPDLNYVNIRNACAALLNFFCGITGFDPEDKQNQEHCSTAAGLAVSPYAAMSCITDMMRTRNFMMGIQDAILSRRQQYPRDPVLVFYAGTGPFASLLIPLTTVFTPDQLQMVLVDINPISTACVQRIVEDLALQPYVKAIETADATQYKIPEQYQPDILLTETMKAGLLKEPQFTICAHLLPQCKKDPILIPESIAVGLCISRNKNKELSEKKSLASLIRLDRELFDQSLVAQDALKRILEGVLVQFPDDLLDNQHKIVLETSIRIFRAHQLKHNESGLTIPVLLNSFLQECHPLSTWRFRYRISSEPYFEMSKE